MLRSFFGDEFQFFVNVEYDFKVKQVGTDFSYVLKKSHRISLFSFSGYGKIRGKKLLLQNGKKVARAITVGTKVLGQKALNQCL